MRISITKEDIELGQICSPNACPIARAIFPFLSLHKLLLLLERRIPALERAIFHNKTRKLDYRLNFT
jgi:hypothetical protein